ncbi:MAG: glycosyltransferase family 9 protein [Nitrospirae bacterium]|nr:glycosyltransferase family 9 protein [Nitrospirota bacterium]
MSPSTIKNIDFYLGRPLCFILTAYDRLKRFVFGKPSKKEVRKIVFIKLVEQGATVLAYPSLKRAVDAVGSDNVYFCVFKENRPILDILDIIPAKNIFEISNDNPLVFARDMLCFFFRSRRLKIDTSIDMEFFSRASAIISYLCGASNRIGYHRYTSEYPYRGNLMTQRVQYNPYIHVAKAYMILTEAAFMSPDEIPVAKIKTDTLKLYFAKLASLQENLQKVKDMLQEHGLSEFGNHLVILNPNAGDMLPLRKWAAENFVRLAKRLLESDPNIAIVLTGALSEQAAVESIRREIGSDRTVNLAGKTTLKELLTLYSIADVLVTNDSGPGHFATLTDIAEVILFGPETPDLFGPIGRNVEYVCVELSCSPCVNVFNHRFSPCKDNVCMKSISADSVFEKVTHLLSVKHRS